MAAADTTLTIVFGTCTAALSLYAAIVSTVSLVINRRNSELAYKGRQNSLRVALFNKEIESYFPLTELLHKLQMIFEDVSILRDSHSPDRIQRLKDCRRSALDTRKEFWSLAEHLAWIQPPELEEYLLMVNYTIARSTSMIDLVFVCLDPGRPEEVVIDVAATFTNFENVYAQFREAKQNYLSAAGTLMGFDSIRKSRYELIGSPDLPKIVSARLLEAQRDLNDQMLPIIKD